jgi:hypothetical protein
VPLTPEDRRHLDLLRAAVAGLVLDQLRYRRTYGESVEVEAAHAAQLAPLAARVAELEGAL